MVSGDYRGFLMIWDMEDIEKEMVDFNRKKKTGKKEKTEGIYFLRGKRVLQHSNNSVAEVLQHNSLLEHRSSVTGIALSAKTLVSGSRDRTFNVHSFGPGKKQSHMTRRSYL